MNRERDLVHAVQAGDGEAFAGLVRLHQARLRALAARYVADPDEVYDLVQDAFIDAYRAMPRFDIGREFGPWLRTICRNRVMSHLRERAARRTRHLALVDDAIFRQAAGDGSDLADDEHERIAALKHCLGGLQDAHRELVDLRYRDGLAVKEISARFGKSEAGMAMMLMRIRDALMRCVLGKVQGA